MLKAKMDKRNATGAGQLEFELIPHQCENSIILQRAVDGYVSATAMCQAVGKNFANYFRLESTQAFLNELATDMRIHISNLVVIQKGGNRDQQGTWVHPDVAVHLGQWCSPRFAVAVSRWVREWMTGKAKAGLPYHIQRYMANMSEIPRTHFSILNEMVFGLIAPLEKQGYTLPDNMLPDISEGKMFCKWLRDVHGIDTDALPTYRHAYADGRVVNAAYGFTTGAALTSTPNHLTEIAFRLPSAPASDSTLSTAALSREAMMRSLITGSLSYTSLMRPSSS